MCGIAGVLRRRGGDPRAELERLVASMWHRGPDGAGAHLEGPLALGMRRLAILDLEHGRQPFSTPDGDVVAFVNGEIYNHEELRRALPDVVFETGCDAEVLPHAYRRWGIDGMLARLDGMFAIALLDRAARRLHLARDRFGEKPLFYSDEPGRFAFCSQLSSLCLLEDLDLEIDGTALRHYLALHYVPGERTLFRALRRVAPGHRLELRLPDGRPQLHRWHRDAPPGRLPLRYPAGVERSRALVSEAVRSRLLADVPVGVFLSGGVDSSAIAAAASRASSAIQTFSIGFEDAELDESPFARRVAAHLGTRHHHFAFDLEACLGVLDQAIAALDEPLGDPACLPVFLLAREARQHVKVVLSGEGADELFGGYAYYPAPGARGIRQRLGSWRRRGGRPLDPVAFFRADDSTSSGFPMLTTAEERDRFVPGSGDDRDPWIEALESELTREPCAFRRAQRADVATWLADDLLPKLDHMTMAASLEGRAPFLEPRLADTALAAPVGWKVAGGTSKRLLRDVAAPWLPREIFDRPKQGFVLPMQRWLAGPLRERLLDELAVPRADGLDHVALRETAEADIACGATRSRLLYAVLAYREWWKALREQRTLAQRRAAAGDAAGVDAAPDPRAADNAGSSATDLP